MLNLYRRIKNWDLYGEVLELWKHKGNYAIVLRSILGIYTKEKGK